MVKPYVGHKMITLTRSGTNALLTNSGALIFVGSIQFPDEAPAYPVLPFLGLAAFSGALAFVSSAVGTLLAVPHREPTVAPEWDSLVSQLMLYGFAVPVAFVFSVRNLPLFLRLAMPPRDESRYLALAYAL